MRANLLPRPKETIAAFGIEVDSEVFRQALLGLAFAIAIISIGIGIEHLRLERIDRAASEQEAILSSRTAGRTQAQRLALEVARYQEIAREEETRPPKRRDRCDCGRANRKRGAYVRVARTLSHDSGGFEMTGGSHSIDALSGAMLRLGTALPNESAELVSIDNHETEAGIRFTARVANAPAPPGAP